MNVNQDNDFVKNLAESINGYDWFGTRRVLSKPLHFIEYNVPDDVLVVNLLDWIETYTIGRYFVINKEVKNKQRVIWLDQPTQLVVGFENPKDAMLYVLKYS